tara:strand:+ start:198 stop:494 length:297 start_codon:yes stop_codon:yes gene_type:complete
MKVEIKSSPMKDKRLVAIFFDDNNKKIRTTHFGLKNPKIGAFPDHNNEKLKTNYLKRHKPRENWSDMYSRGALSRWILWNKKTIKESIEDFKRRFKLK